MTDFELKVISMVRQYYKDISDPIDDLTNEQVKKLTLYTDYGLKLAMDNFMNDLYIIIKKFKSKIIKWFK
jgi:hypothetical protein